MPRRLVLAALMAAFVLATPTASRASTLDESNGVVTFAAVAGRVNNLGLSAGADTLLLTLRSGDADPITQAGGCSFAGGSTYTCDHVTRVVIDLSSGDDVLDGSQVASSIPLTVTAGDGDDTITGGAGADSLDGGADGDTINGNGGNDALAGGDGDDTLNGGAGADTVSGGDGIDRAFVSSGGAAVSVSLDGVANDGAPGEGDNIQPDIENVGAGATDTVSIAGSDGPNWLVVTAGKGTISGGAGSDILEGGAQDDAIDSRDGSRDTVLCGGGTDTVQADTLDVVSPACESVTRTAVPGGSDDDRPPTIAWGAPRAHARITNSTTLSVTANDDRGVTRVQFYDDERLICTATTAPYTCVYRPRGSDVGRNTLIAVAFDGAAQTTAVMRAVTVTRFRPSSVSLAAQPRRDRSAPYAFTASGRVRKPSTVAASQGCRGSVTVTAKAGKRTVKRRKVALKRNCTYRARLTFAGRPASRLRLGARFGGNAVLSARSTRSRTVRTG
jgi:hypothetical protein